jgi:predicted transcriptional regulator
MVNKEHVAKIVSAYARKNTVTADQLPAIIASVHAALAGVGGGEPPESPKALVPAVPIRRSIQPNSITCLDCGYRGKMLKRHLQNAHGLTVEAYRERWGLKRDYPVVAPTYAARRSELAKAVGLGRRRDNR